MIKNGIRTYYIRQHLESFKRNQSCGIRLLIRSKLPHRVSASTSIHRQKKKFPANKRDFSEKIGYVPSSGKSTQTIAQNERCKSIKIESNTKLKSDVKQTRETCLHAGVFLRSSLFPKNLRKERIFVRVLQIKFNVPMFQCLMLNSIIRHFRDRRRIME